MSLTRFHRETHEALRSGAAPSTERAQELTRDKWLAAREHRAIVGAILGNWTAGNCIDFMTPVSRALLQHGELELHHQLWGRTIKRQSDAFFNEYAALRAQKATVADLLAVDVSMFDSSDWSSYTDKRASSAFLLKQLLAALSQWESDLDAHQLDTLGVRQIADAIAGLRRPKIEIPRG